MKYVLFPLLAASSLAACGMREPLRPVEGQATPPAPAAMNRTLTTDELLTTTPIARPARVDELLRRSEEREDDRFDLPPPELPAGTSPVPSDDDEDPQ